MRFKALVTSHNRIMTGLKNLCRVEKNLGRRGHHVRKPICKKSKILLRPIQRGGLSRNSSAGIGLWLGMNRQSDRRLLNFDTALKPGSQEGC